MYVVECGGKMHLREGEFEKAHTDFFEAFKNYDESGSPRRTTCLKYLVLANMWVLFFYCLKKWQKCELRIGKALDVHIPQNIFGSGSCLLRNNKEIIFGCWIFSVKFRVVVSS
jgi:hypothetical protein